MLTRPRRQAMATLALIAGTILPTIFVACIVHHVNMPVHLREVEAEIGRRLGVLVEVGSAAHPRPGVDVLHNVVLRLDPDERSELAMADSLTIVRDGAELAMTVPHLILRGDGPSGTLSQVVSLLRRAGSSESDRMSLVADRVTVDMGTSSYDFRDLAANLQKEHGVPTLTASYLPVDEPPAPKTRCELILTRTHTDAGPRTTLQFKTTEGPLPVRLLGPFFDAPTWFGPSAKLEGSVYLTRVNSGEWDATFRGELSNVDLSALMMRRFSGHRLTGLARVVFEEARWSDRPGGQGSGWTLAKGTLSAGQGSISPGLLKALASEMKFRIPLATNPRGADVDFQSLGLSFALASSGELMLGGGLGSDFAPDAVIMQGDHTTPLAKAPEGAANVRGLWKTLISAPAEAMAPAVPEAQVLRSLPLPKAEPGRVRAN